VLGASMSLISRAHWNQASEFLPEHRGFSGLDALIYAESLSHILGGGLDSSEAKLTTTNTLKRTCLLQRIMGLYAIRRGE
jgi:hypothetical protein